MKDGNISPSRKYHYGMLHIHNNVWKFCAEHILIQFFFGCIIDIQKKYQKEVTRSCGIGVVLPLRDWSCRLLHGQPRQPFKWNYIPLLTGRLALSNEKRNLRKYSVVFVYNIFKKKSFLADPVQLFRLEMEYYFIHKAASFDRTNFHALFRVYGTVYSSWHDKCWPSNTQLSLVCRRNTFL